MYILVLLIQSGLQLTHFFTIKKKLVGLYIHSFFLGGGGIRAIIDASFEIFCMFLSLEMCSNCAADKKFKHNYICLCSVKDRTALRNCLMIIYL